MTMATKRKPKKPEKTFRPVHPNAGIELAYRRKLERLIAKMNRSVKFWLRAAYRQNEPVMAQDDTLPASALRAAVKKLAARWQKQFNESAPALAEWFAQTTITRSDQTLRSILRKGGFSVRFKMTPSARDIMQATINQQVSLIKSIPSQYFTEIEGMVMRSVQTGRDLQNLTVDLRERYGITRRRAEFIARDQNNKATAAITRARQDELGVVKAKWRHSGGGRHPRPTHVAMDGKTYDIRKGMYDPAVKRFIFPGEEPNCRCVSIAIIPGFD